LELLKQQAYVVLCGWRKDGGFKSRRNAGVHRAIKRKIQGTLDLGLADKK
jgi:hypothetical protein